MTNEGNNREGERERERVCRGGASPRVEVVGTNLLDDLLERPFFIFVEFGNQCPLLLPDI